MFSIYNVIKCVNKIKLYKHTNYNIVIFDDQIHSPIVAAISKFC